jgi:hypothetical protein
MELQREKPSYQQETLYPPVPKYSVPSPPIEEPRFSQEKPLHTPQENAFPNISAAQTMTKTPITPSLVHHVPYEEPPKVSVAPVLAPSAPPSFSEIRHEISMGEPMKQQSWFSSLWKRSGTEPTDLSSAIASKKDIQWIREKFGAGSEKDVNGLAVQMKIPIDHYISNGYLATHVANLHGYEECIKIGLESKHLKLQKNNTWTLFAVSDAFRKSWPDVMADMGIKLSTGKEYGLTYQILKLEKLNIRQAFRLKFDKNVIINYELSAEDVANIFTLNSWADFCKILEISGPLLEELRSKVSGWEDNAIRSICPDFVPAKVPYAFAERPVIPMLPMPKK